MSSDRPVSPGTVPDRLLRERSPTRLPGYSLAVTQYLEASIRLLHADSSERLTNVRSGPVFWAVK